MRLVASVFILILVSTVCAFEVSPPNPGLGERITITGTADPDQSLRFQTSFEMSLPVSSGRFEYEASGVEIPQTPNRFAVSAKGVKDLNVGVKIGIWITKKFTASNGVAYVSQSDVPPGRYDLRAFGEALEGASSVSLDVMAETEVVADSQGRYSLSIATSGIAAGPYEIEGAGETKVIQVGGAKEAPSSMSPSGSSDSSSGDEGAVSPDSSKSSQVEITPGVISWYATQIQLDPKNPDEYSEAEKRLQYRLAGNYWKVIARGDPLTENAGDCEDIYCLVRGVDACTSCRAEEIRQLSIENAKKTNKSTLNQSQSKHSDINRSLNTSSSENNSISRPADIEKKDFISWLIDIILRTLGVSRGG